MATHIADVAFAGARAVVFNSKDRAGNALYDMSWCALAIPFTLLTNYFAAKMFTPTKPEKEHPLGAKKISTLDDLGDVAFKTAVAAAAFAPITLLAKLVADQAGYGHLKSVQQPLMHQMAGNAILLIGVALGSHLLGCLFDSLDNVSL
ncbi:MAG: hypothetical protein AB7N99_05125 [Simkaniaceae bacterium]|jgi:hypothetical protein